MQGLHNPSNTGTQDRILSLPVRYVQADGVTLTIPLFWRGHRLRINLCIDAGGVRLHGWLDRGSSVSRQQQRPVALRTLPERGLFVDEAPEYSERDTIVDAVVIDMDREIEERRSGVLLPEVRHG